MTLSVQLFSTHSVGLSLTRRFNAGSDHGYSRRVATIEQSAGFRRLYATQIPS
jgi:hypothetical protein